jgi:lantibiotic modifying enzyme
MAGIAWTFAELGWLDEAVSVFEMAMSSRLRFKFPWIFDGAAGWGLAALELHRRTNDVRFLNWATGAAQHIVTTRETDTRGTFWRDDRNGVVRLGYAYGGSGTAYFLALVGVVTGESRYVEVARQAVDFAIAHARAHGRDGLTWGATTDDAGHGPYWLRGGGGVASALIRMWRILGATEFLVLARRAALSCAGFFSAAPHSFEGLAAMGETLLDMYTLTGEEEYLALARLKARQTLLFRIEREHGVAFPGRFLFRISHDLGTGGAGVGLFLLRTLEPGPRPYHDLTPAALPVAVA